MALEHGRTSAGVLVPILVDSSGTTQAGVTADYRGLYPESYYVTSISTLGVNTGDVLYTSADVTNYNTHIFMGGASSTTGNFNVFVSLDGTNYSGAVALEDGASTTPATRVTASANTTSYYILRGKFKNIVIKQSGATAAKVYYAHGVT